MRFVKEETTWFQLGDPLGEVAVCIFHSIFGMQGVDAGEQAVGQQWGQDWSGGGKRF